MAISIHFNYSERFKLELFLEGSYVLYSNPRSSDRAAVDGPHAVRGASRVSLGAKPEHAEPRHGPAGRRPHPPPDGAPYAYLVLVVLRMAPLVLQWAWE